MKWCEAAGCEAGICVVLDDLHEHGWDAFKFGNSKSMVFCPDHREEMKRQMRIRM